MNPKNNKNIIIIAVILVLAVVILLILLLAKNSGFRVASTYPEKVLPSSSDTITYEFSEEIRPLEEQNENAIVIEPDIPVEIFINNKTLEVRIISATSIDQEISVKFNEIASVKNNTYSKNYTYKVSYVPFKSLSEEEKNRQIESSKTSDDSHPLLSRLPYDEVTFRITYLADKSKLGRESSWQKEKDNFVVYIETFALEQGVDRSTYIIKTRALREDARNWIREQGVDPEKDINISYTPSDEELSGQTRTGDGGSTADE